MMELKVLKKSNDESLLISLRLSDEDFRSIISHETEEEAEVITIALERLLDFSHNPESVEDWKVMISLYRMTITLIGLTECISMKLAWVITLL